jgi:hypothetical protein
MGFSAHGARKRRLEMRLDSLNNEVYDVVLSFAGEDRDVARQVAHNLTQAGVNIFFDEYTQSDLWGKNLYEHLSKIYGEAKYFCLIFISCHYLEKVWTNHERRSAQARALGEKEEYILPVRLDDTSISGILDTVAYFDLRKQSPEELSQLLIEKIKKKE